MGPPLNIVSSLSSLDAPLSAERAGGGFVVIGWDLRRVDANEAMEALTRFVLDPAHHDLLAIVKGARNGLVYGAKIRFPHALVMSLLFRSGR